MKKKIIFGLIGVVALVGGVAGMSAYEAHVINVTAHIENALAVNTQALDFGTVFPQEYMERQFTIELSTSFQAADRVDDVEYVIKQKPKCKSTNSAASPEEMYAPVNYVTHSCPDGYTAMLSLCPYLSKTDGDPEDQNDTDHESYFVDPDGIPGNDDEYCLQTPPDDATGLLTKIGQDFLDLWIVDLKVPPVKGFVGQDWPADCPVVDANDMDYGCDLWIEVTGFSETPKVGANLDSYEQPTTCNVTVTEGNSIQDGINNAVAGQTVCVEDGTYSSATIDKSLVLVAVNGPTGTALINGVIEITANNVTVKGFEITGGASSAPDVSAIYMWANTSGHIISDNIIDGSLIPQSRGILFGYDVYNVTVTNNKITEWHSGSYINPTTVGNIDFTYNDFYNNTVGIGSDGINNVDVKNNEFTNNVVEAMGMSGTVTAVVINTNNIVDNGTYDVHTYGGVSGIDAQYNWWGETPPVDPTNILADVDTSNHATSAYPHN